MTRGVRFPTYQLTGLLGPLTSSLVKNFVPKFRGLTEVHS